MNNLLSHSKISEFLDHAIYRRKVEGVDINVGEANAGSLEYFLSDLLYLTDALFLIKKYISDDYVIAN